MIRRGLQVVFLCGITCLGAAPSYCAFPQSVTVDGMSNDELNGYYSYSGEFAEEGSRYVYYNDWSGNAWILIGADPIGISVPGGGEVFMWLGQGNWEGSLPYVSEAQYVATRADSSQMPQQIIWRTWSAEMAPVPGTVGVIAWPPPPDPYEEAFPDWESAAVKIPLGFGLAMAFWAASVALTIPMKWIRDLTSSAT